MTYEEQKGSRSTALRMRNLGARWGWAVIVSFGVLYRRERDPGLVWTGMKKKKYVAPTGV